MQRLHARSGSLPLAALILCLASFGVLIPWLGFYWDDWPSIWYLHVLGPSGFVKVFTSDRPLLGWLFWVTTSLLGEAKIGWQLFGFSMRWLASMALWWVLRGIWPKRSQEIAWITLLFVIYPGFGQQFIAVTYSHVFIILSVFLLSLGVMIQAYRRPRWFWALSLLALLLSAYSMFSVEYFFGLELLRPVLLWSLIREKTGNLRARIRRLAVTWLPYVLMMGLFLYWRIALYETPRGDVQFFDKFQFAPILSARELLVEITQDIFQGGLLAWGQTLDFSNLRGFGLAPTLLYLVIVGVATAISIFYLARYRGEDAVAQPEKTAPDHPGQRWVWGLILLGLYSLLISGWPFWMTNLPIELRFPWDRFTLAMMPGASLLVVGLISLIGKRRVKVILLGALIGLAVGRHFWNANLYRREWNTQTAFFWQLSWRAPQLQPGTLLLASELPFEHFSDNSLTAPLNWIYNPGFSTESGEMDYLMYAFDARLGKGLAEIKPGVAINEPYRIVSFHGSTSQALVLYFTPPGCLKILDPLTDARLPQKPKYIPEAYPLSNLDVISPEQVAGLPSHIFGPQPEPDWCYYYEKADLARQFGNWKQVTALGEQAFALGKRLYAVNAPEYLPYIEGFAYTGDWSRAVSLTHEAYKLTARMERILCDTWRRVTANTPESPERRAALDQIQGNYHCFGE